MGGLFIDVFVVWLFKAIQFELRLRGTSSWPVASGIVRGLYCTTLYTTVQITYTYISSGETYAAIEEKPFLLDNSAEEYQRRFAVGSDVRVRVNPRDPNFSIIRDEDQLRKPIAVKVS